MVVIADARIGHSVDHVLIRQDQKIKRPQIPSAGGVDGGGKVH